MQSFRASPSSNIPTEAPIPGRYISKRDRAALASGNMVADPNPPSLPPTSPVLGTISESDLPHAVLSKLRHQTKGRANLGQIPEDVSITLHGHSKPVNTVQWSGSHGEYFM